MRHKRSTVTAILACLLLEPFVNSAFCAPPQKSSLPVGRSSDVPPTRWANVADTSSVPMVSRTLTLHFPDGPSLGRLILVLSRGNGFMETGTKVGAGSALIKVTLPPGYWLGFEPNHVVFENPGLLNKVSPEGIECLRVSFTSLDDKEDGMCDRALSYVSHFKYLRSLVLTRSDATDAGVAHVKGLTDVEHIDFVGAPVNGSCFSALSTLPHLLSLNCSLCRIEEKYFALLPRFKALQSLIVNRCNLTRADFQVILKMPRLTHLCLANNGIVDDELIKSLTALKNLTILDVRDTKVTPAGLEALKGKINLKYLYLSDHGNSSNDKPRLEKAFPGIQVDWAKRGNLDQDTQILLSPLRH